MFFEFLTNMRQKPEYVRYQISLWGAVLVTGCIATVFILTQIANGILGSAPSDAEKDDASEAVPFRGTIPLTKPDNIFQTENVFEDDDTMYTSVTDMPQHGDALATTTVQVPPPVFDGHATSTGAAGAEVPFGAQNGAE
jgi:hypothetical protein